jgi:hypothetical protein
MNSITNLWNISILSALLAAVMLVALGLGRRIGARSSKDGRTEPSKFTDASTALFGLLLAFSFGMSIVKHDQRRLAVVADSNAIGDFYTCASLLKEPTRTSLQDVIRKYAQLRLDVARKPPDPSAFEAALSNFERLHSQMTELVAQALSNGTPIAVSLTNTLNAVTSSQASRLAAYRDRLPSPILLLLFVSATLTAWLDGRDQGLCGRSDVGGTLCFIVLASLAVYVTLDLNQPDRGWIAVSQEPIERLLSSMSP